ncbi:protease modulator HflK [Iodidimonas gelatinilytica]|uniref:Protein HflK n=1 Tax=Iodidimonas gelatinilytica TaxID=1236966 RepID=A0A5A7MQ74_9PROT|nr:FtsH protease activity modulator HflK [Iodidimonas gelatinilytica]GEQ97774.1 protease modulator HflK [Iodidimonas gelatinilytica]GER01277.1 protease modulator HflK [Iodidimonas gelatinilytica]
MPWQNTGGGGGKGPWGNGPSGPQGPRGPYGPKGPQGPQPNLDDLMRKGQERLQKALPGGAGGKSGIVLLIVIALLLWAATGVYRVNTDEQGIVLRFGEAAEQPTLPGLHWHLPWPIETVMTPAVTVVNRVDVGFRQGMAQRSRPTSLLDESLMLTGDENIVDVAFTVFWQISNARDYLFNIQTPQEDTVKAVAESVMREIVGRTQIQRVLTEGRGAIEEEAGREIQRALDEYGAGILIGEVKLEKVDPPLEVIDAFRDVQAAEADRERYRNEADRYANQIIPEARGRANQLLQEAEAYKEQVIAQAQGDAARFLSVYEEYVQAKDVTKKRIYLETMENIFADMEKVIMDDKSGTGVVPYMALPEIKRRSNTSSNGGGQ